MRYYGNILRWAGLIIDGSRLPNINEAMAEKKKNKKDKTKT
jgi:hypothetical protein